MPQDLFEAPGGRHLARLQGGRRLQPLQSVNDTAMHRVLECAQPATGYGMINATTFLNHVVDTKLMVRHGHVLSHFWDSRVMDDKDEDDEED